MEVGRQMTLWFIACCCASIICTEELADYESTTPSEDSSNWSKPETGHLNGKITAQKNGNKVTLTLAGNVLWKIDKSVDDTTCAVALKGERGDRGFQGPPGVTGIKGEKRDKGDIGYKGEKGNNGTMERKGKKAKSEKDYEDLDEREVKAYGESNYPAYSCALFAEGEIYLNEPNAFQVECKNYIAYIKDLPMKFDLIGLNTDEIFGLSSKIEINEFYSLSIPNLSYLLSTNNGFNLTLTYSDEVEIIEILSWNGIKHNTADLISNKLLKGQQGCMAISETNKEKKTNLKLSCLPAYYLPMEFYIKAKKDKISIEFKELCFK